MIRGRVIGKLWSTRRVDTLPSGALLEVAIEGGSSIIAFDPLGCNDGESVAAGYFKGKTAPVDALIIGSIDEQLNSNNN